MERLEPAHVPLHGQLVIEASAGTGKTYTITSLFLRMLLERDLTVDQILVVTYTRAATAELRDRIRGRLRKALSIARGESSDDPFLVALCAQRMQQDSAALVSRLERALAAIDQAPVLTIHAFCQRVLSEHAFESGAQFDTELSTYAVPLLEEIADDFFTRELFGTSVARASLLLDEPLLLRRLAARVGGRGLRVVPESIEEQPLDGGAFADTLAAARRCLSEQRTHIASLLAGLKSFGEKSAERALETVDGLLAKGDHEAIAESRTLAKLTRAKVAELARGTPPEHAFFDLAQQLVDGARAVAEARTSVALAFRRRFVDYLEAELARRTRARNVRTFDALLGDLDEALRGEHGSALRERLRTKYRAALVDEFQDTDPVQYRIFRTIFAHGSAPLFMIGDPKQAIYGFRGADVAAYLGARAEADRVYTLDVNHRSDPGLIRALNALYARVTRPFLREEIAYLPIRPPEGARDRLECPEGREPVDVLVADVREQSAELLRRELAALVASDIVLLLSSSCARTDGTRRRPLTPGDVAVLCRTNAEAALVQLALGERGVPSVLSGDASVFDSDDAPELERALLAMAHPADGRALRSFLASIYGGHDAHALLALESDDVAWEEQRERMQEVHDAFLAHGFMQALRVLVRLYEVEPRLLLRSDGARRVTNLWHLAELLSEAAERERLGPLGLVRWFQAVRADEAMRSELTTDAHELRLEGSDDAVALTTVHKSKGLEYPLVYCPFSWDAAKLFKSEKELVRFHDPAARNALSIDLGSPDRLHHEQLAEDEALAEALRLLYVALTRAKHRVTVVVPSSAKFAASALAYTLFGGGDPAELATQLEGELARGAEPLLRAQSERAERCFSVRAARIAAPDVRYVQRVASVQLAVRPIRRALDSAYRVASFSALVARGRDAHAELGVDRDAVESAEDARAAPMQDASDSPLALGRFTRGAVAGQLVHEVLEEHDFRASAEDLTATAERLVRARGYASELVPELVLGLSRALATPLDGTFCLGALERKERVDEMEFAFPVDALLTPRLLERLFRAHGAPPALPSYASELRELGFDALHGYMRGYIDLVYRHDGRYFVVDYKSNYLGPLPDHYREPALTRAMAHHHYFLQYHLYVLALHRHLTSRLRGYAYERDFGGVYYLFLRGMAPEHAPGTGVYFDRPSAALIRALDGALAGAPVSKEAP